MGGRGKHGDEEMEGRVELFGGDGGIGVLVGVGIAGGVWILGAMLTGKKRSSY